MGNWQVAVGVGLLFSVYLWRKNLRSWLIWLWVSLLGAQITTHLLKLLVARPRPEGALISETGYSFPSGHAVIAVVLYGLISYFLYIQASTSRYLYLLAGLFFIILIGYSRFYLGVHYFSDILGGYFIGLIWLFIGQRLARVF